MFIKRIASWLSLVTLVAFAVSPAASGAKLYKWVDQDGKVTYQDQPPPEDAQSVKEYRDPEVRRPAVAAAGERAPVTLYSVEKCDACDLVRLFLQKKGVPFSEIDVGNDREAQQELLENVGQLGVPTLMVGNTPLAGYSPTGIEAELRNAGYLPPLEPEEPGEEETAATDAADAEQSDEFAEQSDFDQPDSDQPDTTAGNF
ncbi:MAG: DUF4124 domain-containing protein [Gammaproteobacteria bacterium]|nr:DUF4124 domain-containing protein [Gammaproteobacteria bacterium]